MPRPPQHSVEVRLERVANWNCHASVNYGTLRPRRTNRDCDEATASAEPSSKLTNTVFSCETGYVNNVRSNRSIQWRFLVVVGIVLAGTVLVSFLSMECRTSSAPIEATALRLERNRLKRCQRSLAETITAYRAFKSRQDKRRRQVDHASELMGGNIEATPQTEDYLSRSPTHLLRPANELGHCWGFFGRRGVVIIRLGTPIKVTHVAVVHLGRSIAAPKDFNLAGLEGDTQYPMGSFTFDLDRGSERQEFLVTENHDREFQRVRFEITSNHGNPDTCVYSLQVYGLSEGGIRTS